MRKKMPKDMVNPKHVEALLDMYKKGRCEKACLVKQLNRFFDKEKVDEIVKNILTQK